MHARAHVVLIAPCCGNKEIQGAIHTAAQASFEFRMLDYFPAEYLLDVTPAIPETGLLHKTVRREGSAM